MKKRCFSHRGLKLIPLLLLLAVCLGLPSAFADGTPPELFNDPTEYGFRFEAEDNNFHFDYKGWFNDDISELADPEDLSVEVLDAQGFAYTDVNSDWMSADIRYTNLTANFNFKLKFSQEIDGTTYASTIQIGPFNTPPTPKTEGDYVGNAHEWIGYTELFNFAEKSMGAYCYEFVPDDEEEMWDIDASEDRVIASAGRGTLYVYSYADYDNNDRTPVASRHMVLSDNGKGGLSLETAFDYSKMTYDTTRTFESRLLNDYGEHSHLLFDLNSTDYEAGFIEWNGPIKDESIEIIDSPDGKGKVKISITTHDWEFAMADGYNSPWEVSFKFYIKYKNKDIYIFNGEVYSLVYNDNMPKLRQISLNKDLSDIHGGMLPGAGSYTMVYDLLGETSAFVDYGYDFYVERWNVDGNDWYSRHHDDWKDNGYWWPDLTEAQKSLLSWNFAHNAQAVQENFNFTVGDLGEGWHSISLNISVGDGSDWPCAGGYQEFELGSSAVDGQAARLKIFNGMQSEFAKVAVNETMYPYFDAFDDDGNWLENYPGTITPQYDNNGVWTDITWSELVAESKPISGDEGCLKYNGYRANMTGEARFKAEARGAKDAQGNWTTITEYSQPFEIVPIKTELSLDYDDNYRFWFDDDGKLYLDTYYYEQYDRLGFNEDEWIVNVINTNNCTVGNDISTGMSEYYEYEFGFDVTPSKPAFSFDVMLTQTVNGITFSGTVKVGTNDIGNKVGLDEFEMPLGMDTDADSIFKITRAQMDLVGGYAVIVPPAANEDEYVIEAWNLYDISAVNVGVADVYLYSLLDMEDRTPKQGAIPLAGPLKITVIDGGYDWYELEGPDPVLLKYGETGQNIEFTLYGERDGERYELPMDDSAYVGELCDWNVPDDAPKPTLTFAGGKLVVPMPQFTDVYGEGDYWGNMSVIAKPKDRPLLKGMDTGVTISVFHTMPEIRDLELDTGKGDFNPGYYQNNATYSLYYTAKDADGNDLPLTQAIFDKYFFAASDYEINWDGYNPDEDDNPKVEATGYALEGDQLKVTFNVNYVAEDGDEDTYKTFSFWNYCHYGDNNQTPRSARVRTEFEVYIPDADRTVSDANIWINSDSSQPFKIPAGAEFHIGYDVIDADGNGIEGYPVDIKYQYLNNGVWADATPADIFSGAGAFPAKAKNTAYMSNGQFVATQIGGKLRARFTINLNGTDITFTTDTYQVVAAATSVTLKQGASITLPQVSRIAYDEFFTAAPAGSAFLIGSAKESDEVNLDRENGFIFTNSNVGEDNTFIAYAPGKRLEAAELTVTIGTDRMWAYIHNSFPKVMGYGQEINVEPWILWMTNFNVDTEEETFEHFSLNDNGNTAAVNGTNGIAVAQNGTNDYGDMKLTIKAPAKSEGYTWGSVVFTVKGGGKVMSFTQDVNFVDEVPAFGDFEIDYDLTMLDAMPFDGGDTTLFLKPVPVQGDTQPVNISSGYSFIGIVDFADSGREGERDTFTATPTADGSHLKVVGPFYAPAEGKSDITGLRLFSFKGENNEQFLFRWEYHPNVICERKGIASATVTLSYESDETGASITTAAVDDRIKMTPKFFDAAGTQITEPLEFGYYLSAYDGTNWTDYNSNPGDQCALGFSDTRWVLDANKTGTARVLVRAYKDDGSILTAYSAPIEIIDSSPIAVSVVDANIVYDGTDKTPALLVTAQNGSLILGEDDYTVSYVGDRKNVGLVSVEVKGAEGTPYGTATASFYIAPKPLTDAMVTMAETSFVYNRAAQEPAVVVSDAEVSSAPLVSGKDYYVEYFNNTNVTAEATAQIAGMGNYTGAVRKTFAITPKNLVNGMIQPIADQPWTGAAITPEVVLKDEGATLIAGTDYENVVFGANIKLGEASVTVTGKGNYGGTAAAGYNIVAVEQPAPAGLTSTGLTVKGKNDGSITGLTTAMEMKKPNESAYTAVAAAGTLNDLAAGTYLVRLPAKQVEGQTVWNPGADASVVVADAPGLTFTFDPNYAGAKTVEVNGLAWHSAMPATAPILARDGYDFKGWYEDSACATAWNSATTIEKNVTVYAKWEAKQISYKVEHYQADLTGSYVLKETETKTAAMGEKTLAASKGYAGFMAQLIQQQTVAADGSTVIQVKYDRNSYPLVFRYMNGATPVEIQSALMPYDAPITAPSVRVSGMMLTGWTCDDTTVTAVPEKMPAKGLTFTAVLNPATTTYTVVHSKQLISSDRYGTVLKETLYGPRDATAEELKAIAAKSYAGFNAPTAALNGKVLTLTYTRKTYTLTVARDTDAMINVTPGATYTYGDTVNITAAWNDAAQTSHRWNGFKSSDENLLAGTTSMEYKFYMPAGDVTLTAQTAKRQYVVAFDPNGGTGEIQYRRATHGEALSTLTVAEPTKQGYHLDTDKWGVPDTTQITSDMTLKAKWVADTGIAYTVEYYKELLSGGYELAESESKKGATDAKVAATDKAYEGFKTGYDFAAQTQTVAFDGSTVVKIYYDRVKNKLTFQYKLGASGAPETASEDDDVKYGTPITAPAVEVEGWVFNKWGTVPATMPAAESVYTATLTAATNTAYTVNHYLENASGSGDYALKDAQKLAGVTQSSAAISAKTYEGFTAKADNPATLVIAADGSAVANLYYNRDKYAITFKNGLTNEDISTATFDYAASLTSPGVPATATKDGVNYTFAGWIPTVPPTVTGAATYVAQYTTKGVAGYTVEHWKQKIDSDEFEKAQTDTLEGAVDVSVTASPIRFEGFTYDASNSETSGVVKADGTLTLKIYYARNSYTLTFDAAGGTGSTQDYVNFGAAIDKPTVTRAGYKFVDWSPSVIPATMPASNLTFTATWEVEPVEYTAEYYYQKLDGTYAAQPDAKTTLKGTAGFRATAPAKNKTGFSYDAASSTPTGVIAVDGSLTLSRYYSRNTYTMTFQYKIGNETTTISGTPYRFGAPVAEPNVSLAGYTAGDWSPAAPQAPGYMPANDVTCVKTLTPNTDTPYRVEYYLENLNGTWPETPAIVEEMKGTTDVEAAAAEYTSEQNAKLTGFQVDKTNTLSVPKGNIAGDGSTVLKLYYLRNVYLLQFDTDGDGKVDIELKVKYGALINQQLQTVTKAILTQSEGGSEQITVQTPIQENKVFTGWKNSDRILDSATDSQTLTDAEKALPTNATGNLFFQAKWADPSDPCYVLNYYMPGAAVPVASETVYTDEAGTVTVPEERIKKYDGYEIDMAKTGSLSVESTADAEPKALNVYFKKLASTLTVDAGANTAVTITAGGNPITSGASVEQGAQVTVKATPNAHYTFVEWLSDNIDLAGSKFAEYTFTMPKSSVTLTVRVTADTYKITYDNVAGIDISNFDKTYTYGAELALPTAADGKKTLLGWMINGAGDPVTKLSSTQSGDIILTPVWADVIELTFDAGEGVIAGTSESSTTLSGPAGGTLTAPTATLTGKKFGGWFAGETEFKGTIPNADTTYTAKWTEEGGGGGGGGTIAPTLTLSASSKLLYKGATAKLTYCVTPASYVAKTVTWTSADPAVATVTGDAGGATVTAVSVGKTTVTVKVDDMSADCLITVDGISDLRIAGLTGDTLEIKEGESKTLAFENIPEGMNPDLAIEIADKEIASGSIAELKLTVTGLKAGTTEAKIILKGLDGTLLTFKIKVTKADPGPEPSERVLLLKTMTMGKGMKVKLANLLPYGYTGKVTWLSGDTKIAKISAKGKVIGVKNGATTLTAMYADGTSETLPLEITDKKAVVKKITGSGKLTMQPLSVKTVSFKIKPDSALNKTLYWFSSDEKVATVENGVITSKKPGTAYVTALAGSGVSKVIKVTVTKYAAISSYAISDTQITIKVGEKKQFSATVLPAEADQNVTWKSDKPKIAKIDKTGLLTALKPGQATVTCVFANDKKLKCTVTVIE